MTDIIIKKTAADNMIFGGFETLDHDIFFNIYLKERCFAFLMYYILKLNCIQKFCLNDN